MTGEGRTLPRAIKDGESGCRHPAESVGRFMSDVCADCDADVGDQSSAETCTLCDFRVAVVAAHRLGDVALHVTRTRPLGDDARCLECVLDDLTRLVVQVNR